MPDTTPFTRYLGCFTPGGSSPFLSMGPKHRGSASPIGWAPMHTTSLRIPPMPVAAPPYGSIAEGWLWLSILRA